jgi:hypothetical protein
MLIVPGKFIFLATPRTGSRTIVKALKFRFPEALETKEHHVHPEDVRATEKELLSGTSTKAKTAPLPMCTVLRDPYRQSLSWYYLLRKEPPERSEENFADCLKTCGASWYFYDRLYPYSHDPSADVTNVMYEEDLMKTYNRIMSIFGLKPEFGKEFPEIGRTHPSLELLTPRTRGLINERFKTDISVYRDLVNRKGVLKNCEIPFREQRQKSRYPE